MKHIDKVFKDKLFNHEANVPDGMWDKIAPALEEKSSRGLLWFWVSGLAILLIGGLLYMLNANDSPTIPLTENIKTTQKQNSSVAEATIDIQYEESDNKITSTSSTTEIKSQESEVATKAIEAKPSKPIKTTTPVVKENKPSPNLKTKSTASVAKEEVKYGKPANLVITKSYINDNGSVIKQSNITSDDNKQSPVYNVFINSEGLNAGALLRVVQPIEKMPLPAFSVQKKKITL